VISKGLNGGLRGFLGLAPAGVSPPLEEIEQGGWLVGPSGKVSPRYGVFLPSDISFPCSDPTFSN